MEPSDCLFLWTIHHGSPPRSPSYYTNHKQESDRKRLISLAGSFLAAANSAAGAGRTLLLLRKASWLAAARTFLKPQRRRLRTCFVSGTLKYLPRNRQSERI